MSKLKLTKTAIDKLVAPDPSGKQVLHWDTELRGFGVLCSGLTNSKSYVVQRDVKDGAKGRRVTIGATNVFGLDEAREEAVQLIAMMAKGIDPKLDARARRDEEAASAITLHEALEIYLAVRKDLKPRTAADYRSFIERHLGDWLDKPLNSITPDIVEERHQAIQQQIAKNARTGLETGHSAANGTMRILRLVWNHAAERLPDLPENPTKRLRRAWYPEQRREGLIRATDLPKFYEALMDGIVVPNLVHRDYLCLVLFTGLRRREAASLRWDDVDLEEQVVRLPAASTKSGRRLDLPMSDYLFDLLQVRHALGRDGAYVFPANSKSGHIEEPRYALDGIEKATGIKITIHDLRRTFITVAESCDIPIYALKGLVNHSFGTDVTAGYIVAGAERLREPMQKVTDKFKELIGLNGPDYAPASSADADANSEPRK
jgi:integrase